MCGIAGIIADKEEQGSSKSLYAMTEAITHRGPDDYGYYERKGKRYGGGYVGLGHRRLSIIDIHSGKQPLTNEDETIFLVFNGEIYNFQELRSDLVNKGHVFTTSSDTEVIVHAYEEYGEECVSYLRGMFAFAIWDTVKERLYLARDRFGKKPLFYKINNDSILFSSEIKSFCALTNIKSHVRKDMIEDYLVYRYVPGPDTLYEDVFKLQAGSYATYRNGVFSKEKYYIPWDQKAYSKQGGIEEPVGSFLKILRESVELRMVSDVPYGAFLSGGIDSSAIVGLMTECSQLPVKTFSVGFKESSYSELKYAEVIASYFDTEHYELTVSHEELIQYLPELVRFRDAPISEPSDIPIYLLAKEASKSVKMVLTGEGSDEILGGYTKHVFERYVKYYQLIPKNIRQYFIEPVIKSLPYKFRSIKTAVATAGIENACERHPRWFGGISYQDARKILAMESANRKERGELPQFLTDRRASTLRKILYFDQTSWLPDNLLERGDRMTMAASIEARMPFLDHKLAEYVSGLPDKYRVRGLRTKWILRESMRDLIPAEILERPKVGFRLPVNEWFRGPLKEYLYDALLSADSLSKGYYHKNVLRKVLKEHIDGHQNHEKLLWAMLNLEVWLKVNQPYFEDSR